MKYNKNLFFRLSLIIGLLSLGLLVQAQNQKVWTNTSKLFGINGATNPTSTISWSVGNFTASTTSKADSLIAARATFARYSWLNPSASLIVDTVKVSESVSGCLSSTVSKLIEVYPLPSLTMGTNQTICSGALPAAFSFSISNYASISGIGNYTISYELRAVSATGTALGGSSTATVTGVNSGTVNISTTGWPAMTAGTTYYFVITNFGSEITATASNPAPGNLSSIDIAALPRTYTIAVNPAITAPSIQAY
ncbi:MAG: hypothetical protein SGJ00_13860 [bacterium]|nr:hypothetical protein [bacterium]